MNKGTFILSLGAVAVTAYIAGSYHVALDGSNVAIAQDNKQGEMPQMTPEEQAMWEAWDKAGKPGEHHKVLNDMVGTWDAEFSFKMTPDGEMLTSRGTVSREWVLNKHFVREKVEASGFGPDMFHGLAYVGYNNITGVYETVWMDDTSTAMMTETGTYDPATKKFHFKGTHLDPATGSEVSSRSEIDLSNPNRHVFIGWTTGPDGKEYKSMHGVTEKK